MPPPDPRRWRALALLCVAQFMVVVDVTVINVALPSVGADLDFGGSGLQWVITGYALAGGGLLLLGGRAADAFGARRTFVLGVVGFSIASLVCGIADSAELLIGARVAQGASAALLSPAALGLVTQLFSGAERTRALSLWGAIGAGGAAVGMLLGGALTTWVGWRSAFLINVPIGLAAAALAPVLLPRGELGRRGLDVAGALTALAGLGVLVYGLERAATEGWGDPSTLALLGGGAALLALFLTIERHVARPLVRPALLRVRSLSAGASVMLVATGLMVGTFFLGSLLMQHVLGLTPLETGLGFLPSALAIAAAMHVARHVMTRGSARAGVAFGFALAAAGALLLSGIDAGGSYFAEMLPGLVVMSFAAGLLLASAAATGLADVPHGEAGVASGVMTTAHEIGAAFGVAVLSAIALAGSGVAFDGSPAALADGASDAYFAVAGAGAVAALLAALVFPAVRPSAEAAGHAGMH